MNTQNQKINFYQKRTLVENITITFDFLKDHWKMILKLCVYFLLPLSIVQGIFSTNFYSFVVDAALYAPSTFESLEGISPMTIVNYVLLIISFLIGQSFLSAIVYTVLQKSLDENSSESYSLSGIKDVFISYLKQCFILTFYLMFVILGYLLLVGALAYLFPYFLVIIIPVTFALIIPLILIYPAYIFGEDSGTNNALKQSFKLGFPTWGNLFLLMFALGIVCKIIQIVAKLPWYITFFTGKISGQVTNGVAVSNPFWLDLITYLFSAVHIFGSYIGGVLILVGAAFHYFSALEGKETLSDSNDIDNFDQL